MLRYMAKPLRPEALLCSRCSANVRLNQLTADHLTPRFRGHMTPGSSGHCFNLCRCRCQQRWRHLKGGHVSCDSLEALRHCTCSMQYNPLQEFKDFVEKATALQPAEAPIGWFSGAVVNCCLCTSCYSGT